MYTSYHSTRLPAEPLTVFRIARCVLTGAWVAEDMLRTVPTSSPFESTTPLNPSGSAPGVRGIRPPFHMAGGHQPVQQRRYLEPDGQRSALGHDPSRARPAAGVASVAR